MVSGSGFAAGDTVAFGSVAATSVRVNSATSITATAPAGTGTVDVTVASASGTSAVGSADQFSYTTAINGYSVALTSSAASVGVGSSVTLTATANQDVGPTPYGLYIYDVTTGVAVAHVPSGASVSALVSQSSATTQRYVAYVTNNGPVNIQAASSPAVVTWS